MKGFVRLAFGVLATAVLIASCSKDENTGRLAFDSPALYLEAGGTASMGFTAYHVKSGSFSVTSKPTGWSDPVVDAVTGKISVTAPAKVTDDAVESGNIVLAGVSNEGSPVSASLFVGIVPTVDLSAEPANSYITSKKNSRYLIDATAMSAVTGKFVPASVKVIWQTASSLLQYVQLENNKISFYIGVKDDKIKAGNALIGAYDDNEKLLWSWHIWVADYDPEAEALTYLNGYTVMDRNLGALENKNSTQEEILASYGLYYQWGRKEPFVGPYSYNASNGSPASMYNGSNSRVYLTMKESDATTGTSEYALQNPLNFITGVKASEYDWRWSNHTEPLWSDTKTDNDPCPRGWKVAPVGAFAGLRIAENLSVDYSEYENKYGWTLTDNSASSLYMATGRRVYTNGAIQNVYQPTTRNAAMEAQPWVGFYWTTKMEGAHSSAFYFWFDKSAVAKSGIEYAVPHYRANGMTVRCVKDSRR